MLGMHHLAAIFIKLIIGRFELLNFYRSVVNLELEMAFLSAFNLGHNQI